MEGRPKVSVIMACYREPASYVSSAIESILNQTFSDFEFLIVLNDSDNIELLNLLNYYKNLDKRISVLVSPTNLGVASKYIHALQASGDYIAFMDADDIALPHRLEKQLDILEKGLADIVGAWIEEFDDENGIKAMSIRKVPELHEDIVRFAKWRNPMNDPTVMLSRKCIRIIKNIPIYISFGLEYLIWTSAIKNGCRLYNIQEVLLKFRFNRKTYDRRRGLKVFCSELYVLNHMREIGFLSNAEYYANLSMRFISRVLLSPFIKTVYRMLRRA